MLNVFAIGNLTCDPEETENGCRFVIACNAPNDTVDYLTVFAYGKGAEATLKYMGKGCKLAVTGRLHCDIRETDDNVYLNETVSASTVDFLTTKVRPEADPADSKPKKRFNR